MLHIVVDSNKNVSATEKTAEDYSITAWWLEISPWDMSSEMKPYVLQEYRGKKNHSSDALKHAAF